MEYGTLDSHIILQYKDVWLSKVSDIYSVLGNMRL